MHRRLRPLAAVALLAAALTARGAEPAELVIGITQYPATLHPNIESMLAKTYVLGMIRRPMTVFDHGWKLACLLCLSVPDLADGTARTEALPSGGNGIAVTYDIHPAAVWGDGVPITTRDVVFTWQVGREPRSGVAGQELYRRILRVDAESDKRFTMHVDRVTFDYQSLNGFELLPEHLERSIFEADPGEYRHRTRFETDPTNPGLHFGPYRIESLSRGAHVVLVRNPRWWGAVGEFARIVVRVIEKTAALEANLLAGGIDYIAGELGLAIDQAVAFEKRHGARFEVEYKPGLIYEHIDMNLENPLLADLRVRRALLYGIDRAAISEQLFGGKQPVADTNVNPLDWVYHAEVPKYRFDPDAARRLLDEAGWSELRNGVRHDREGRRLTLELMTTAGDRTRELVQQVLQSQWRNVGVEVRIRNEPARVFFGETVSKRKFTGLAMYAWISAPESVPRSTLHSSEIPTAENGWSGQNATGYRNPEMDRLIDAIEVELDREKRRALWARLQEIYATDLPVLPLYFRANAFVMPRWLQGVRPTGHQYSSTLWVEQWRRLAR